jgi:hypothetical protein
MQETMPRERRGGTSDDPTLFDFDNPLELRVEKVAAGVVPEHEAATQERDVREEGDIQRKVDDITAELVRLLEGTTAPQPTEADDPRNRPIQKQE